MKGRRPPAGGGGDDVIVEFQRVGNAVKVSAFDPATLTEVSIVGAPGLSEAALTAAVMRKLEYVLSRNKNAEPDRRAAPRSGRPVGKP